MSDSTLAAAVVAPVDPVAPVAPVEVVAPVAPVAPVEVVAPVAPVAPVEVVAPVDVPVVLPKKRGRKKRVLVLNIKEIEKFKALLQVNLSKVLITEGQPPLSQGLAYDLFAEAFDTIVMHTATCEKRRISLTGIGRFYIKMGHPRRISTKPVSKYAALGEIPHFRWKPSFRYFKWLIQKINNVDVAKLIEEGVIQKPSEE